MDENHQNATNSHLTTTENKIWLPPSYIDKKVLLAPTPKKRDINWGFSDKSVFDWAILISQVLGALAIPFVVTVIGLYATQQITQQQFQAAEKQHQTDLQVAQDNRAQDLQIAKDTQEEAALKAYLDDMTTLLFDDKLGSQAVADKAISAKAAIVAQAKTLTVLRRLTDGLRKATVVQFLYKANLIGYFPCVTCPVAPAVIDLSGADLFGADLFGADLFGADLINAHLSRADLSRADLSRVDLSGADLSRVDLSGADLSGAHLSGADLSGANLSGTHLSGADLSRANLYGAHLSFAQNLTQQQLDQVYSCRDATLPQGLTCHHNQ